MKTTTQITDWKLRCLSKEAPTAARQAFSARVPGDITDDLMRAQLIDDIQFASNYKDCLWVNDSAWEYSAEFTVSERALGCARLYLHFAGIDTFSEIYVNGVKALSTSNMFLAYDVDVKPFARVGRNKVKVIIRAVPRRNETRYFGAFTSDRLLVRKAQCHFGWDWAPSYMGMGLWGKVCLTAEGERSILSVRVRTRLSGEVTFFPELSYSPRKEGFERYEKDVLRIRVFDGDTCVVLKNYPVTGHKNLCNLTLPSPKLWYPNGYGQQNLYRYCVEIIDEAGYAEDTFAGTFGVRSVTLCEEPTGDDALGFFAVVNGRRVFLKGSNWVPASFMTGAIEKERYKRLLLLAKDAGFNVLRVWGGGIYEQDIFYDLCDELGLLVWQDFMFACGDVPDDNDGFCRAVEREAVYEVKRLSNHACMLLWNGGNEIRESFAYSASPELGKYVSRILAGVCAEHTDIPYFAACPWSYTDFGNDLTSGDCHRCALFEATCDKNILSYRDYIIKRKPVATEIAAMAPCRLRHLKKFLPESSMQGFDEHWEIHCVNNPYEPKLPKSFAQMEWDWAEALFGVVSGIPDFVKKGMIAQADLLTAEIDECRADAFCGGALNWMYNDNWRNATWAVVDYDFGCKAGYYAMKRAFQSVRAGFTERNGMCVYVVNNSSAPYRALVRFGRKRMDGQILCERVERVSLAVDERVVLPLGFDDAEESESYLYASLPEGTSILMRHYRGRTFESDVSYTLGKARPKNGRYYADCTVHANRFAKAVYLDMAEEYDFYASDNYFDLEAGAEALITLSACKEFTQKDITLRTIAEEWD